MVRFPGLPWLALGSALMLLSGCEQPAGSSEQAKEKAAPAVAAEGEASGHKKHPANRLAKETSPYLLLHAHNPVDWHPWGPEAFETARKENKLIFLSIGYSSCYWCHVMERLVFSNEKIAKYMNEHFVNIKVDREERPDVDDIYMTALSVYFQMAGSRQGGGWPLSMFLTPSGKPIAGGTYFPPTGEGGRPGFDTVSASIADAWKNDRASLERFAESVTKNVQQVMKPRVPLATIPLKEELVTATSAALKQSYDPTYGGVDFNPAAPQRPKFPVPAKLALLEYQASAHKDEEAAKILDHTLTAIAAGGIKDHLAGGFHRYSTERTWLIPHFEKMLYDNAQLLDVYAAAFARSEDPVFREIVEEIVTYALRDMTDSRGGFYSAQDAETDAIEGKYYVWSKTEVEHVLGTQDFDVFASVYGMQLDQRFEHGFILHLPSSIVEAAGRLKMSPEELSTTLAPMRQRLLAVRGKRPAPLRDDKVLTSWNGLMIRGLANSGRILKRNDYVAAAEKAARFIFENMRDSQGRLHRTYRTKTAKLNAYLDDYAFFTEGVLALYLATGKQEWLDAARKLTDEQIELFWDKTDKGFFFTSHHHEELLARTKNAYDAVLPSGNSVSVRNLIRLAVLTKDEKYRKYAQDILDLFAGPLQATPRGMTNMALALAEYLDEPNFQPAIQPTSLRFVLPSASVALAQQASAKTAVGAAKSEPPKKKPSRVKGQVFLSVDRLPAGKRCELVMLVDIEPGWHINTNPAKPKYLVPTRIEVKSKQGVKLVNVRYPVGKQTLVPGAAEPTAHYEKRVAIRGTLEIPDSAAGSTDELTVLLHYQACNENLCLRPAKFPLVARLQVAKAGEAVRSINQKLFQKRKAESGKPAAKKRS